MNEVIKVRGIMQKSLRGFITFRSFMKFIEIEQISQPDPSYQRDVIKNHKNDLEVFINQGENLFFPELVLGYITNQTELNFNENLEAELIHILDKKISDPIK